MMLTLWPTGSTQPVAASGWVWSGEAATQIVWVTRLTNVTTPLPARATHPRAVPARALVAVGAEVDVRAERAGCGVGPGIEAVAAGRAISGAAADGAYPAPVLPARAPLPGPAGAPLRVRGAAPGCAPPAAQAASSSVTTPRTTAASARNAWL